MIYLTQPTFDVHQHFTVLNFISLTFISLQYFIITSSSINHLLINKKFELSSLPLHSNFMLIKFQIITVNGITIHTLLPVNLSIQLAIYIFQLNSIMIIVLQLFFSLNSPSNYEISQFRLWAPLKVVLTLFKVFLTSSSSRHMVYKIRPQDPLCKQLYQFFIIF